MENTNWKETVLVEYLEELIERLKIWIDVSNDKLSECFGNSPYWHFSYQNKCM